MVFALVDSSGSYVDQLVLKYYSINNPSYAEESLKIKYEADKEQLENFIEKFKPDITVIAANCLDAKRMKMSLAELMKGKEINPFTTYGDSMVPQIYSKTQL